MKRSPRDGWALVELRDGRWHLATTGDREQLKGVFATRALALYDAPTVPGLPHSQRHAGRAVALYDAVGQRRDECPPVPRLADGTRVQWPATVPADGVEAVVWEAPSRAL